MTKPLSANAVYEIYKDWEKGRRHEVFLKFRKMTIQKKFMFQDALIDHGEYNNFRDYVIDMTAMGRGSVLYG